MYHLLETLSYDIDYHLHLYLNLFLLFYFYSKIKGFKMTKAMREDYYDNPIEFKKVCTPFCAIELDDYEMFVNLLTVDFNVNLTNERGETLLMKAIEKENVPMVRCLINNGVDIYQMDYNYDMAIDLLS